MADYIQTVLDNGGYLAEHYLQTPGTLNSKPQYNISLMDKDGKCLRDDVRNARQYMSSLFSIDWSHGVYRGTEWRTKEWHDKELKNDY